jgi:hypothetical protein
LDENPTLERLRDVAIRKVEASARMNAKKIFPYYPVNDQFAYRSGSALS